MNDQKVVSDWGNHGVTTKEGYIQVEAGKNYQLRIEYFDNGQDARAGAFAAEALFKETYPGIMVYPVYENPYFKVVVGNCLTAEEAIILKGKIASTFPKAFVKSEEFSMADLLN